MNDDLTTTLNLGFSGKDGKDDASFPKRWQPTTLGKKEELIKIPEEDPLPISIVPSRGGQMKPPLRNRGMANSMNNLADIEQKKTEPLTLQFDKPVEARPFTSSF